MPDKPATVAAYAAAASLAAITFFYVIGPNYLLDGDSRESPNDYDPNDPDAAVSGGGGAGGGLFSRNGRKHTIVGLINDANDCFMNSTLQALAPLYDLRLYLIRELHRREADGREIYESLIVPEKNDDAASSSTTTTTTTTGRRAAVGGRGTRRDPTAALLSLQRAPVTRALKQMLDALNERPIYRKTTTIQPFVTALERAFQAGINRNQQDAQEFLQIVLERVWEEYKAGERVREEAKRRGILPRNSVVATVVGNGDDIRQQENAYVNGNAKNHAQPPTQPPPQTETDTETDSSLLFEPEAPAAIPFPFLGKLSSQVECRVCGYLPKPKTTTFTTTDVINAH
ncbi:Peptidase C19, ubiquitin carboxyl-terminal hydrolase 2 [Ascosphaera apis ARSEF 7405]|uniref:Peptidase C19, ubiquitin carboxyl-terminal hydrolase 2 n=1 Tax=Ascosphaera apis ARSEF 7405 TaxID=392613 RepID=A0A162I5I6_9EURO|nr:Peptidase C19, ubiquitin carboxyl-terminal hydrolase 2 [Ascosphaera apis ARSEF 7405]